MKPAIKQPNWLRGLLIVLACGLLSHGCAAHAQTFEVTFTPATNGDAADSFHLWYQPVNASDTNKWFWLGQSATNAITFAAPASNPCLLAVTANLGSTNQSAYSEPYLFDTNNFVVAKQLNLFPPRFLKVTRKP